MQLIEISTCNHLGDALCLTAAAWNAREEFGDAIALRYAGNYGDVFRGLDLGDWPEGAEPTHRYRVEYRSHNTPDDRAQAGNLCEGLTLSLARWMASAPPVEGWSPRIIHTKHTAPVVALTEAEVEEMAALATDSMLVLANTNCQGRSSIKAYPWWGEVVRQLCKRGYAVALTGGPAEADIRGDLGSLPEGCVDLRGKTTARQLVALCRLAACVVSPPSSLIHAAAAVECPAVCVCGAREPTGLTAYPLTRHLHSVCIGAHLYNHARGCMHFRVERCERAVTVHGRRYASCMACIPAEAVAEAVAEAAKSRAVAPPATDAGEDRGKGGEGAKNARKRARRK